MRGAAAANLMMPGRRYIIYNTRARARIISELLRVY
nr:MAG TPA: hypothetical protein [Caudoviricetes sp.]